MAARERLGIGRVYSLAAGRHARRQALAIRGLTEYLDPTLPQPRSPVQRGLVHEAYENRQWAMENWIATTEKYGKKR